MPSQETSKKPIWKKNWLIIALLVFLGPIGIPLAWLTSWPRANKVGATVASALFFVLVLAGDGGSEQIADTSTSRTEDSEQVPDVSSESEKPAAAGELKQKTDVAPAADSVVITESANPGYISQETWEGAWPFTVDEGVLDCQPIVVAGRDQNLVIFTAGGLSYAINGSAQGRATEKGWEILDRDSSLWRPNPENPEARIGVGDIISKGQEICEASPASEVEVYDTADLDNAIAMFELGLGQALPDDGLIQGVAKGDHDGQVRVTVSNDWLYSPEPIQLQAAQNLWKMWATVYAPTAPDKAKIEIVDINGNRIAGSSARGGSDVSIGN